MGFVVIVEIEDGDQCPEFTRNPEFSTRDMVFKEVVGIVYAEGVVGQIYVVKLIQQSHPDEATLLTQRVIPSGLEYTLTVQKLMVGYLLVAHPMDDAENIWKTYPSWDALQRGCVEHLDSEPEELQQVYAELEKNPFAVLSIEARKLVTASVVAALCA